MEMKIGNRKIGPDHPPLVIAEIGINHGGSLRTAYEMVDAAYEAGAEIIKHQTHIVNDEMSKVAKNIIPKNADISIFDIMSQCSLSEEDEMKLKTYTEEKGIIFLSTPFSRAAANRLEKMGVVAYKIGSGECNNYPLINHIASFRKPMIVSTGMNNIESIQKTVQIIEGYHVPYALLHCTNMYPTKPEWVRLGAMKELETSFPNAIIGLSDHTINNNACFAAAALGASILERHFTDRKDRIGPDIACSMDKQELKDLLIGSKEIFLMRGGEKEALAEEQVTIDFAFATVVTTKPIKRGELFTEENIWVKRPGTGGIGAESYSSIIGRHAIRDLEEDIHVSWADIEEMNEDM